MSKSKRILEALSQYTSDDKFYRPVSGTKQILAPGVYEIKEDMQGILFEKVDLKSDDLIKINTSKYNYLMDEINKFWEAESNFKDMGVLNKRAFILHSIPGTGKSCILKQVMNGMTEAGNITFVGRHPRLLVSGLKLFREVEESRKALVILEEVDEMIDMGGSKSLADLLDGPDSVGDIFYLGTTNYLEKIPERLLRPSRFDRKVEIHPPSKEDRYEYFKAKLTNRRPPETIREYAEATDGFTFAHLKEFLVSVECLGNPVKETIARLTSTGPVATTGAGDMRMGYASENPGQDSEQPSYAMENRPAGTPRLFTRSELMRKARNMSESELNEALTISENRFSKDLDSILTSRGWKFSYEGNRDLDTTHRKTLKYTYSGYYNLKYDGIAVIKGSDVGDIKDSELRGKVWGSKWAIVKQSPNGTDKLISFGNDSDELSHSLDKLKRSKWHGVGEAEGDPSLNMSLPQDPPELVREDEEPRVYLNKSLHTLLGQSQEDTQRWLEEISADGDIVANPEFTHFKLVVDNGDKFYNGLLDKLKDVEGAMVWLDGELVQGADKELETPEEEPHDLDQIPNMDTQDDLDTHSSDVDDLTTSEPTPEASMEHQRSFKLDPESISDIYGSVEEAERHIEDYIKEKYSVIDVVVHVLDSGEVHVCGPQKEIEQLDMDDIESWSKQTAPEETDMDQEEQPNESKARIGTIRRRKNGRYMKTSKGWKKIGEKKIISEATDGEKLSALIGVLNDIGINVNFVDMTDGEEPVDQVHYSVKEGGDLQCPKCHDHLGDQAEVEANAKENGCKRGEVVKLSCSNCGHEWKHRCSYDTVMQDESNTEIKDLEKEQQKLRYEWREFRIKVNKGEIKISPTEYNKKRQEFEDKDKEIYHKIEDLKKESKLEGRVKDWCIDLQDAIEGELGHPLEDDLDYEYAGYLMSQGYSIPYAAKEYIKHMNLGEANYPGRWDTKSVKHYSRDVGVRGQSNDLNRYKKLLELPFDKHDVTNKGSDVYTGHHMIDKSEEVSLFIVFSKGENNIRLEYETNKRFSNVNILKKLLKDKTGVDPESFINSFEGSRGAGVRITYPTSASDAIKGAFNLKER